MYAMGIVDLIFAGNWYNFSKKLWILILIFQHIYTSFGSNYGASIQPCHRYGNYFFLLSLCPFCYIFVLMILTWYHEKLSAVIQHSI